MAPVVVSLPELAARVACAARALGGRRALLVGLSGIDGSGKGFVAASLAEILRAMGLATAVLNVDGWLNLPDRRFGTEDPAGHFYRHAIRFEAMFTELVLPLRDRREIDTVADLAEETAVAYRRQRYRFTDVDLVLLEGIFLFKRGYRPHFDLAAWIECSFETALERAVARAQEGLPPEATIHAYRTIYFPAQHLHATADEPRAGADFIVPNDPRLGHSSRLP